MTADLVDLGWLPAPDCDKDALSYALIDLIERAIRARVIPSTGSEEGKVCFFSEIKRSTIDTLVELRWLRADHRDDLSATVKAFRRFAGRSLAVAPQQWACKQTARATAPGGGFAFGSLAFVTAASVASSIGTANNQQAVAIECMTARGYNQRG